MNDLKKRMKAFAIDCWKFCSKVPNTREYNAFVNQLIRSSSSVGANYRACQRAKSTNDFINKLKIVEEEVDESIYWLEIFSEVLPNSGSAKAGIKSGDVIVSLNDKPLSSFAELRSRIATTEPAATAARNSSGSEAANGIAPSVIKESPIMKFVATVCCSLFVNRFLKNSVARAIPIGGTIPPSTAPSRTLLDSPILAST